MSEIIQGKRSISDLYRILSENLRYYYFRTVYGIDLVERFVPYLRWGHNYCIHMHRYMFALDYIKRFGRKPTVIDLGCGVGYGDSFLSEYCEKIIGIDISDKAIKYAKSHYQTKNITYICADIIKDIPRLNLGKFDIVLSFEVVEHIPTPNRGVFFGNFNSLLDENGIGIITTPHNANRLSEDSAGNPYHFDEMNVNELTAFLDKYFATRKMFAHYVKAGFEDLYSTKGRKPDEVCEIKELNEEITKKGDFGLISVVTKKVKDGQKICKP